MPVDGHLVNSNMFGDLLHTHPCCSQTLDLLDLRQRDVQPAFLPFLGPLGGEIECGLEPSLARRIALKTLAKGRLV